MSFRTKLFGVLGTAALVATLVGAPAHADNSTLTVNGGSLRVDAGDGSGNAGAAHVGNFATVALDGTAQLTTGLIVPFTVIDDRGTAAGWNVTVTVGDFAGTSGAAQGASYSIPANTVVMDPPKVAGSDGQDTSGWTINGGVDFTGGVKVISALADQTSMGTFVVSPLPLRLTVPTNAYAGGYTSTTSVVLATGP